MPETQEEQTRPDGAAPAVEPPAAETAVGAPSEETVPSTTEATTPSAPGAFARAQSQPSCKFISTEPSVASRSALAHASNRMASTSEPAVPSPTPGDAPLPSATSTRVLPPPPSFLSVRVHVQQVKVAAMMAAASGKDDERPERCGVIMWLVAANGEPLSPVAEWPARKGFSPMWNSARNLVQTRMAPDGSAVRLRIELWGIMEDRSRMLLAGPKEVNATKVPVSMTTVPIERTTASGADGGHRSTPPGSILMHALTPLSPALSAGRRMTVYFVRHGESKWNAAKRTHNVYKMVRHASAGRPPPPPAAVPTCTHRRHAPRATRHARDRLPRRGAAPTNASSAPPRAPPRHASTTTR